MKSSDKQNATTLDLVILWMMPIAIFAIIGVDVWFTYRMLEQQEADYAAIEQRDQQR